MTSKIFVFSNFEPEYYCKFFFFVKFRFDVPWPVILCLTEKLKSLQKLIYLEKIIVIIISYLYLLCEPRDTEPRTRRILIFCRRYFTDEMENSNSKTPSCHRYLLGRSKYIA